jgi:hypothetical protein
MINMLNLAKNNAPNIAKNRDKSLVFLKKHFVTGESLDLERIK